MIDRVFVDTNIVVYTRDQTFPEKASASTVWLRTLRANRALVVSPQVINEAFAVGLAKFKSIPRAEIDGWVRSFLPFCTAPLDTEVVALALDLHAENQFRWWDCLILASALKGNCRFLLSEDMTHRQTVRSVRILNPFQVGPADPLLS